MTAETTETTETETTESETGTTERLPDDHPVVRALAKANEEAKNLRLKVNEFEDANKSEVEKLTNALSEREKSAADVGSALQKSRVENAVLRQAAQKNVIDPDAAAQLLDPKAIEFDDDGHPTNVDKLLDELLEKRPYLAGTKKPAVPARPKPGGKTVDNGDESPNTEGKQRAVDAVRAFRRS